MANIQERRDKSGKLISYSVRVHRGRGADGKQLKPWTATFEVSPTWTEKSARKKAEAFAATFEKECREGVTSDSRLKFEEYCNYVIDLKEQRGIKHSTIVRYKELAVRSHLAKFGYRGEEVFKDCATLSGGEMARLRFAELALERPNLMFLDEPTNHLDIFMRETLTDALSAYTGTLLLVTHDRYLMQTLGCPILYLEDGKATFYQNFQKLHDRDTSKQPEPAKQEDKPQKAGYGKEQRRRRAEVRTRLKALETEIEELGAHIVELENEINDPEVLRDHLLLRDKCDELDDSRFHQQELYDEWEKLAEEQDRMDAESDS